MIAPTPRLRDIKSSAGRRLKTGIKEFDFVLGGGIVPGSMILIGGEPGIGKSTLLLQVAARLEHSGHPTLYASGEESPLQVKLRSDQVRSTRMRALAIGFGVLFCTFFCIFLLWCIWNYVLCVTYVLSTGRGRTSPPLRTIDSKEIM